MQVDTGTELVLAEVRDGVGTITLNRPERRNALHPDIYRAMPPLIERFDADEDVGCILLTAAGPAFCAGGDVREGGEGRGRGGGGGAGAEGGGGERSSLADDARMVVALYEAATISIAALPGPAAGAGIGIALATDFRIAAAGARLIPGWGRLGLSGDFGGPWFLSRLLGPATALELLVDGVELDAQAGFRLGLFQRVVPDSELDEAAFDWARSVASGPRAAYRFMKENVRDAHRVSLREALVAEAERMRLVSRTEDHRNLVRAWLAATKEKRGGSR